MIMEGSIALQSDVEYNIVLTGSDCAIVVQALADSVYKSATPVSDKITGQLVTILKTTTANDRSGKDKRTGKKAGDLRE